MNLKEKIDSDFRKALKKKDKERSAVLSILKSAIRNEEIAKKKRSLNDDEVQEVINREVKQRRDSMEQFKVGGRQDLLEKEKKEIDILQKYLPRQLSDDEIRRIVEKAIDEVGAEGISEMGKIMGKVMPQIKGKADGSKVSQIVRDILNKQNK